MVLLTFLDFCVPNERVEFVRQVFEWRVYPLSDQIKRVAPVVRPRSRSMGLVRAFASAVTELCDSVERCINRFAHTTHSQVGDVLLPG